MEIKFNKEELDGIVSDFMKRKYKVRNFKIKEWVGNNPEGIIVVEIPKAKNVLTPVKE